MKKIILSIFMAFCITVSFTGFARAADVPPPVNSQWAGQEWFEPFPPGYTDDDARRDIDWLFSSGVNWQRNPQHEKVLGRVIAYMTQGTTVGHHRVSRQRCWNYYQATMRGEHPKWEQTR